MTKLLDEFKETEWFKTRPLVVQKAYDIWGPGDTFLIEDKIVYFLGHSETDESDITGDPYDLMLILSEYNPTIEYEKARANSFRVCARHFTKVPVN